MKIEIDGDSPEAVALALLHLVAEAEGRLDDEGRIVDTSRAWLLDAYVECLAAVNGTRPVGAEDEDNGEDDNGDEEEGEGDGSDEEEDEEDEEEDEQEHEAERQEKTKVSPRRRR